LARWMALVRNYMKWKEEQMTLKGMLLFKPVFSLPFSLLRAIIIESRI
jgi:hypothetical protein